MTARSYRQVIAQLDVARRNAATILALMLTHGLTPDELVGVTRSPEMSRVAVETAVALAQSAKRDIEMLVLTLTGQVPDAALARLAPEPGAASEVEEPLQVGFVV